MRRQTINDKFNKDVVIKSSMVHTQASPCECWPHRADPITPLGPALPLTARRGAPSAAVSAKTCVTDWRGRERALVRRRNTRTQATGWLICVRAKFGRIEGFSISQSSESRSIVRFKMQLIFTSKQFERIRVNLVIYYDWVTCGDCRDVDNMKMMSSTYNYIMIIRSFTYYFQFTLSKIMHDQQKFKTSLILTIWLLIRVGNKIRMLPVLLTYCTALLVLSLSTENCSERSEQGQSAVPSRRPHRGCRAQCTRDAVMHRSMAPPTHWHTSAWCSAAITSLRSDFYGNQIKIPVNFHGFTDIWIDFIRFKT